MYLKEQPQHLKKLIKFKKLQEDSFNPQWNQVHYYHKSWTRTPWYNFERFAQNRAELPGEPLLAFPGKLIQIVVFYQILVLLRSLSGKFIQFLSEISIFRS